MIKLKVSKEKAERSLNYYVQHEMFQKAIPTQWNVDADGSIDGRSVCWLFCWGNTNLRGGQNAAMGARRVFSIIFNVSFEEFEEKIDHGWASRARYDKDRTAVEAVLTRLFG